MRRVVLMVRVEVVALVPLGVIVTGEAEQLASAGKPAQARVTAELNPDAAVRLTVTAAPFPATTVPDVGLTEMAKSDPPPVREITWGLLLALSVKVSVPTELPAVFGV